MNKSTRIARATFDIVFLLLLLLPIITYCLSFLSDTSDLANSISFNEWLYISFFNGVEGSLTYVGDVLTSVLMYFETSYDVTVCVPYMAYVVYVCIGWVFVNVLCFIPKLCVKLLKGWV